MSRFVKRVVGCIIASITLSGFLGCGAFVTPADGVNADGTIPNEAACLDLWSLVHFSSGYMLGDQLGDASFVPTFGLLSGYEVIERDVWPGFDESRLNQNCDIVVGSIGWLVESLASQ